MISTDLIKLTRNALKRLCYNNLLMILLASNSPRRQKLLSLGGWHFDKKASDIDESVLPGETPAEYVIRLARAKALKVQRDIEKDPSADLIIVAADTTVVDPNFPKIDSPSESIILGKPAHAQEAVEMLKKLRARVHLVYTGIAVIRASDGRMLSEVVITDVPMRDYSDEEIHQYVESGDPFDKAGAYAIQHSSFHPVQNLQGCYANVMGLPICHVSRLLSRLGSPAETDISTECQEYLEYKCPVFQQALLQADPAVNDLSK